MEFKGEFGKNLHPTQKPVAVLEKIIKIASNKNDIVLDCFNGVGSTGEAALKLNRKYIGIEIDTNYANVTKNRLKKYILDNQSKNGGETLEFINEMA